VRLAPCVNSYEAKLWPSTPKPPVTNPPPASWFDGFLEYERQPRSHEAELKSNFGMWLDNLHSKALGAGATGDTLLDGRLMSNEKGLPGTKDQVTRWLELSSVGSLGFWLSVGLLAGWAMRSNALSQEPAASSRTGSGGTEESL
jgi:hypothetical protein